MSKAKNAEMIRTYFIEVESLFLRHKDQLIEGLQRDVERLEYNQKPKYAVNKENNYDVGYIYVFRASTEKNDIVRIGRTRNLRKRLQSHFSSHADDPNVLFVYKTENVSAVEECIHTFVKKHQYRKRKEVYEVDLEYVKKIVGRCAGIGRLERVFQEKKSKNLQQEGGYYVAVFHGEE
jgi:hypothetical protein